MKRTRDVSGRGAAKHARPNDQKGFYSLQDALKSGSTEIFQAMRLARGFERQKLGRREKDAKESNAMDDVARIEKEIVTLKNFDLVAMAEFYFYKTLLRIPSIATAPQFPASVAKKVAESTKPVDNMYLNVSARLYKSNVVSTALEIALKTVSEVIGVQPQLALKKRLRKSDFQNADNPTVKQRPRLEHDGSSNQDRNSDDVAESGLQMSQTSGTKISTSARDGNEADIPATEDDSDSHTSDSELEIEVDGESQTSGEELEAEQAESSKVSRKPLTTTAFLPSLAGGYISGSESEASDVEEIDGKKVLKNRPGQRARQAHWERKFGNKAAHLQKQRQSRDHGWDAKRGAQSSSARGSHQTNNRGAKHRQQDRTTRNGDRGFRDTFKAPARPKPSVKETKQAPLHPSWEAAKKLKEQKNAAAFQGKKVVFD